VIHRFIATDLFRIGQQVTTLIRQHQRMTGKFKCWRLNTNTNSCYDAGYCVISNFVPSQKQICTQKP